jgi:hypothetical protein
MTVKEKLINTIRLDNGLELKLYDSSRKVAGDRWRVGIVARIDISLDEVRSFNKREYISYARWPRPFFSMTMGMIMDTATSYPFLKSYSSVI